MIKGGKTNVEGGKTNIEGGKTNVEGGKTNVVHKYQENNTNENATHTHPRR